MPEVRHKSDSIAKAYRPLVKNQSLPLFMIAYALAPPLMDVLGLSSMKIGNTGIDIVGHPNSGKTTLLSLAGAVWGTDPTKSHRRGYAEAWSATTEGMMRKLPIFQDGFLGLDDTGLNPAAPKQRAAAISDKVMRLSDGGEKDRYDGPLFAEPTSLLYASTGNASIREFLEGHPDLIDAHETRLITIKIRKGALGILSFVPKSYKSAQDTANALYDVQSTHYGLLGPAFIEKLVNANAKDDMALMEKIEGYMNSFYKAVSGFSQDQPVDRVWRPFALAYAAGRLAKNWGVIPKSWGSFKKAITQAYRLAIESNRPRGPGAKAPNPLDVISQYAAGNVLIDLRQGKTTMTKAEVGRAAGFIAVNKDGRTELQISSSRFKQVFSNSAALLKELKAKHMIAMEVRKSSVKRSIRRKSPEDRVYAIYVRFVGDDPNIQGLDIPVLATS